MAAIGTFYEPVLLNYALLGATATRPTAWALALGAAVPTASTFTEIGTASGYSCQTMPFPSAASATVTEMSFSTDRWRLPRRWRLETASSSRLAR